MRKKPVIITIAIVIIALGASVTWLLKSQSDSAPPPAKNASAAVPQTAKTTDPEFDKTRYSLTDPASLWIIVNKRHPLQPMDYAPTDLRYPAVTLRVPGQPEMQMRAAAATALEAFMGAGDKAGYKLQVSTAYRGYAYQQSLYSGYTSANGQADADTKSARPGYSEHQTGWAVDIRSQSDTCSLEACFGGTPEGIWLAANAYRYGFLLRYPADKTSVTGYEYEPWHFRYVGTDLALELHKQKVETLEEFFNVSGGTTYQ